MTHQLAASVSSTLATRVARVLGAGLLLVAACASRPMAKTSAGPTVLVDPPTAEPAAQDDELVDVRVVPAGANGASDATGMIGPAGAIVTDTPEATLLIHTATMRAHPKGDTFGRLLIATIIGWPAFMPYDLVHPLREIDWVLIAGSLYVGATHRNIIVANHSLDDSRTDSVMAALMQRLPARRLTLKASSLKAIEGNVDGAERAYLQPKPGILAIVPKPSAAAIASLLQRVDIPKRVRSDELARVAFPTWPHAFERLAHLPGAARFWVEAAGPALVLHGEADCRDLDEAVATARNVREGLDRDHGFRARLARGLLADAKVWSDGPTVRYRAELDDRTLQLLSLAVCRGDPLCGLPP